MTAAIAMTIGGVLLIALVAGRSERAGAQGPAGPPAGALKKLEKMAKGLKQAGKHAEEPGKTFINDVKEVERIKHNFVRDAFKSQTVSGCSLGGLMRRMLEIDDELNLAKNEKDAREAAVKEARKKAAGLLEELTKCSTDKFPKFQAQLVVQGIDGFAEAGEAGFGAAVDAVAKEKRRILVGEQVYNCFAVEFFDSLETIDAALGEVNHYPKGQNPNETSDRLTDARREALRKARGVLRKLTRSWRVVPCGSGTVPPNEAPEIVAFTSVFGTACDTCTLYTVTATDAEDGANLKYEWDKQPPPFPGVDPEDTDCGAFTPPDIPAPGVVAPNPNQAVWNHPNEPRPDVPDPCSHKAAEHPGLIFVVVTDTKGAREVCLYEHGSAPTTSDDPAVNC